MTLPLGDSPWLISPDDVFGYKLANVRGTRLADTQACMAVEHVNNPFRSLASGEHFTTQIPWAIHVFTMPIFDPLSDFVGDAPKLGETRRTSHVLNAYGPSVGWRTPPTLRWGSYSEGGAPERQYYIDAEPIDTQSGRNLEIIGGSFCPVFDTVPTWSYDEMHAVIVRKTFVTSEFATDFSSSAEGFVFRVFLGNDNAIKNLRGGTLTVHIQQER